MLDIKEALFGTLRRMHHVRRYSSIPLIHPENVAEHSWQITMLGYLIGLDLQDRGITIAMEMLLRRLLMHDLSEALSGDIIRSFKHSNPKLLKEINDADHANTYGLTRTLMPPNPTRLAMGRMDNDGADAVFMDWSAAKDGLLEGQIVALADMLCVVSKCKEERAMGNTAVNYVLRSMYEEVLRGYRTHEYLKRYVIAIFPNDRWDDPYTEDTP